DSKPIRDILTNPDIQSFLKKIDSHPDPEKLLDEAMEDNPLFKEFAERALEEVLGPRETV
ncbi:hypothetical protein HK097_004729, partial [Rhizophlyctis rosea]